VYVEPQEGPISRPELTRQFPLVFNSGARIQSDFRSQHHNIPGLLKMQPHPLVTLHPRDAAPRGIQTGDEVYVVTQRGRVRYSAWVTEDIVPGVIEANAISGFPVYKALMCDVVKA
jgi:anaerobic selenocysteine-containing dehydrogenase